MIPRPGSFSLMVDKALVQCRKDSTRWLELPTLEEAKAAARSICGATIVQWEATDGANGRDMRPVAQVRVSAVPTAKLDITAAPGRYLVQATMADFREVLEKRNLRIGGVYRYSGPSLVAEVDDGMRQYSFREFEGPARPHLANLSELTIRQFPN